MRNLFKKKKNGVFQKYISSIVADEIQLCNEENKIQKALRIAPNECFVIKVSRNS